jgi:DNA-binding HxlR family transcriptional regulator
MQWSELGNEACSVSRTLSVIGDRWTLLILRECFLRVRRFDDFQARLNIGRPILADRLQKLVTNFVLVKVPYQENPTRYEYRLTPKGLDLYPIILAITHWGDVHMSGKNGRPVIYEHMACGHSFDSLMVCSECAEVLDPRVVRVVPGPGGRNTSHLPLAVEPSRPSPPSAKAQAARDPSAKRPRVVKASTG